MTDFLRGMAFDDEADAQFCEMLWQEYENDPDPEKDQEFTLEECEKAWGIT